MSATNVIFGTTVVTDPFNKNVNANNFRINNLADGVVASDAATLGQVGAGFMENPAIEDLSMSGFKITQLANAIDPSGAVTLNQLSNWANYPATSNITFFGNQGNVYDFLGSGATARGEPAVDVHTGGLRVYGDISSGTDVFISWKDDSNVIQFYDTVRFGTPGLPPSQAGAFYQFKSGGAGPLNYAWTVNGVNNQFTAAAAAMQAERIGDNINQSVNSLMSRWSTNNMLTAGGVNNGLTNTNFVPKINISSETLYFPVIRALDNCGAYVDTVPSRANLVGPQGQLIFNDRQSWYVMSDRVNQNLNSEFFCNNSWTVHIRHNFQEFARQNFTYLCTITDISAQLGAPSSRITLFFNAAQGLTTECELTGASPLEATVSTINGSVFNTTFSEINPYNYFLSYNSSTQRFTINVHDNNGTVIRVSTFGDLSGVTSSAQINLSTSGFQPKFLYIGRSPFPADNLLRGVVYNVNLFEKQLSEQERAAVSIASREHYNVEVDQISLRNIGSIERQYRSSIPTSISLTSGRQDANLIFNSPVAQTVLLNDTTTSRTRDQTLVGKEWDLINVGPSPVTFTPQAGVTSLLGQPTLFSGTRAKLVQTDASAFFIDNPVYTNASGANYTFQLANISGVDNLTCRDIVINGGGTAMPAILIQTNNSTNSMRTVTISGAQQLTEWVWTQEGHSNNLTWAGTNFRNVAGANNRGTFFSGSTNSAFGGNFGDVIQARNGSDWVNVANDFVCLGGTGRGVAILRADSTSEFPANVAIDVSGRIRRAAQKSIVGYYSDTNYSQSLTGTFSQIAIPSTRTDICGAGFVVTTGTCTVENIQRTRLVCVNICMSVSASSNNGLTIAIQNSTPGIVAEMDKDIKSDIQCLSLTYTGQMVIGDTITIRGKLSSNATITIHKFNMSIVEVD